VALPEAVARSVRLGVYDLLKVANLPDEGLELVDVALSVDVSV
jgi:excinuclease UvrABC helicase subunit UvrB